MKPKPKKSIPLWAIILRRFADNGWSVTLNELMDRRAGRSHSQALSNIKDAGVKIVRDKIEQRGEMVSRWTIPAEYRPHAITLLNSKEAGELIPYANLEPPPTQGTLFDIGEMKANASLNKQYRIKNGRA